MSKAFLPIAAALLAAAPFAAAVGTAEVINECNFPVYVWSVGSNVTGPVTLPSALEIIGVYTEQMVKDPVTGGRALKITKSANGLFDGSPQADFAYNLDGENVFYDLSDVFGDPFAGNKLVVASSNGACPEIIWSVGTPPAGSQVKVCGSENDISLTLCA